MEWHSLANTLHVLFSHFYLQNFGVLCICFLHSFSNLSFAKLNLWKDTHICQTFWALVVVMNSKNILLSSILHTASSQPSIKLSDCLYICKRVISNWVFFSSFFSPFPFLFSFRKQDNWQAVGYTQVKPSGTGIARLSSTHQWVWTRDFCDTRQGSYVKPSPLGQLGLRFYLHSSA
jgi:hypothetical protein